jgi:hypothetical protein
MQYFDEVAAALSCSRGGKRECAAFLFALLDAQDDGAELSESSGRFEITQQSWKLMADVADDHPACASVLLGLFEGLAAGCGRHIAVNLQTAAGGELPFVWSIG